MSIERVVEILKTVRAVDGCTRSQIAEEIGIAEQDGKFGQPHLQHAQVRHLQQRLRQGLLQGFHAQYPLCIEQARRSRTGNSW